MAYKKIIGREPYDREGLKTISEILLSGGEIPQVYKGREYVLKIIGGVPQWYDAEKNEIAPCRIQNGIYSKYDTNQDEFWNVFRQATSNARNSQNRYKKYEEKKRESEILRKRELLLSLRDSGSLGMIFEKEIDALKIYGSLKGKKQLLRKYGKGFSEILEGIERDVNEIRKNPREYGIRITKKK
ncbi:MAG: hypothetical protein QXN71_01950 [Candidatus Aenigmatarchaeota archaeon]